MNDFWGVGTSTSTRTVDVYMTKIREKLIDVDDFSIVTVRGLGYKAVPNE
ncbi:MAG: helix-turn-helix domain-containing protein [Lactobacillaceae bacterium]